MATKRQRGERWEYCVKRRALLPRPIYLSFDTEAEGDAYVDRLEKLLDSGYIPPEFLQTKSEFSTVGDIIRAHLLSAPVKPNDQDLLGVLNARIGKTRLGAVNYKWAEDWIAGMKRGERFAPGTIRHYVGALARCFDWAHRQSVPEFAVNPLRMLPRGYASYSQADGPAVEDEQRDRRLAADEEGAIRRILAGEKPDGKQRPLTLEHGAALICVFDLALETAMRLSEIFTLDAAQVDIRQRTIFLDKTKNGDKRQVPLSTVAVAVLERYPREPGYLFPWFDGTNKKRVTSLLSRQFARVFRSAGCVDLHFHDLRHEATSRLYERTTLSDLQIAKITGHKDLRMLRRYANLRASDLATRLW